MSEPIRTYRSVFVSDVHLGSAGSMASEFDRFLQSFDAEHLYLVGDIIDVWVAIKSGKWNAGHSQVVKSVISKSKMGCKVRYTPGNHDAFLRKIGAMELGGIEVADSFEHRTLDGRRLVVIHGDQFDKSVKLKFVAWIGAWLYEFMQSANQVFNHYRSSRGREAIDFCSVFKTRLKRAINYRNNYVDRACAWAEAKGYHGIVCGHVHRPIVEDREDRFWYVNSGDWVEHGTAVVEHLDGRLELLKWNEFAPELGYDTVTPHSVAEDPIEVLTNS